MGNLHVVDIALRLAAVPAAGTDLPRLLTDLSRDLAGLLRVAAVVVHVPGPGWTLGSDDTAVRVAQLQHRAGAGPVVAAAAGEVVVSDDLGRAEPPELAALARDVGLGGAIAAPLVPAAEPAAGPPVGAVVVLGVRGQRVTRGHLAEVAPVLAVLAALLADAVELDRLQRAVAARPPRPRSSPVPTPWPRPGPPTSFTEGAADTTALQIVPRRDAP